MKRILYATDGSCGALAAGKHLSHLPHRRDVHVHIITILPVRDPTAAAEAILETAAESLGNFPGHVTTAVTRGETTGEIATTAQPSGVLW